MARTLDITIRSDPAGEIINRRFTRFVSSLTDLEPLIRQIVDTLEQRFAKAFATEGASSGSMWAPLSAGYRAWKLRAYPGRGILVRTGRLRGSLTSGGGGGIRVITPRRGEIGTAVPYARYHQSGTSRMPARPVIRLSPADREEITRVVHRYLVRASTGRA